jgi:hypothetical protein
MISSVGFGNSSLGCSPRYDQVDLGLEENSNASRQPGDSYFSGPRFIRVLQDFTPEYASVTTRRQSARVSLAATLSRSLSDTHGRLSFQRCALPAICWSPWAKTRNEIIRVGVLQFFIAARFVNLAVSLPQYQFASHRQRQWSGLIGAP